MKHLTRVTWLAASLALAAIGVASAAQHQPVLIGKIEGIVLDSKGQPVSDASVTIQTSDGLHPHATHTDAGGRFQFDRWSVGQYDLRAYSNGYFSEWNKRIVIRYKKTTTVTLRIQDSAK